MLLKRLVLSDVLEQAVLDGLVSSLFTGKPVHDLPFLDSRKAVKIYADDVSCHRKISGAWMFSSSANTAVNSELIDHVVYDAHHPYMLLSCLHFT